MRKPLNITLESARIRSLNFQIKEGTEEPLPENVELSFSISTLSNYNYKRKQIATKILLGIDQEDLAFSMKLEYEGLFSLNKRVPKKEIEPFARINCPAILFPFARECIADITRRAGLTPLLLPAINFVELSKSSESAKKGSKNNKS